METLKSYNMDYIKVPSGEITNLPMLQYVSKLKKPIIYRLDVYNQRNNAALKIFYQNGVKNDNITLLQCTVNIQHP